ncbi:MAG: apolipoprotein N-acyltransferase [Planctomycetaceae bacterium]
MTRAHRWMVAALFLVPAILAWWPGLPPHGYGHLLFALPLFSWLRDRALGPRLLLYGAGLGLQTLAFPDPDLGFLGFFLLVPYLLARERPDGAAPLRSAFLYGFLRAHLGFAWLGHVHFFPWVGVSLGSGALFALVFEGILRRARFLPFALRAACAWLLFEYVHAWLLGGLPWLFLAHTQHRFLLLIQAADLVGAWGISFLLALLQAAAFDAWRRRRWRGLQVAALLLTADLAYGAIRLSGAPEAAPGPGVLLVQSSFPIEVKRKRDETPDEILRDLVELTDRGLAAHPDTSLVVWPETIHPVVLVEGDPTDRFRFLAFCRLLAERTRRPFVYGANTYSATARLDARRGHNSAVLVDAAGTIRGIYRKQALVPMGEQFLPRLLFPESWCDAWVRWLMEGPIRYPEQCDLEAGAGYVTLDAGEGLACATLICFEGLDPGMAREALAQGSPDLLLHLANHGWFTGSFAQEQAAAIWVLRAIETRTPFLSCANTGTTCAVDPSGRVIGALRNGGAAGALHVPVPPRWPPPPYLGFAGFALPTLLVALAAAFLARRRLSPGSLTEGS